MAEIHHQILITIHQNCVPDGIPMYLLVTTRVEMISKVLMHY